MSVLIMSIGVSSVATLFPISVKRSVIATQLTNATILRNNADAFVDAFPNTIHDPDGDGDYLEHYGGVITQDSVGNFSRPRSASSGHLRNGHYIIDPLGFLNTDFSLDGFAAADVAKLRSTFGNTGAAAQGIPRYSLSTGINPASPGDAPTIGRRLSDANLIASNFELPDSWVTEYEGLATITYVNGFGTKFVLDPDEGMSAADALEIYNYRDADGNGTVSAAEDAAGDPLRFVIMDRTFKQGEVRSWGGVDAGGNFALTPFLPNNGRFQTIAQVRLQRLEPRYSWFLTVRKKSLQHASVDIVVAFRRSYLYQDELAFGATIATHVTYDHDSDATTPDITEPNRVIRGVNFAEYDLLLDGGPEIRRGEFLMDIENARWYRIQDYDVDAGTITVDMPIIDNGSATSTPGPGHIMFFPRVIDIFPLGTKALKGF